jgi:tryptophan synthase alpha chain
MNKLEKRLSELKQKGEKAFIPFITCGDPSLEITEELVYRMARAGADMIELGIPFSDPTAEGPVIQGANIRALSGGVNREKIFAMVRRIRKTCSVPLAFMTYANVVFSYGTDRFAQEAADCGIDALILPDVPFEEKDEFKEPCDKYGLSFISLVAPTSKQRIKNIASGASGFLYCVSSLGVTGERSSITGDISEMVRLAKEANPDLACMVGFGISGPEQARAMAQKADGVIVGSAIVRICEELGTQCPARVEAFVRSIKEAI